MKKQYLITVDTGNLSAAVEARDVTGFVTVTGGVTLDLGNSVRDAADVIVNEAERSMISVIQSI